MFILQYRDFYGDHQSGVSSLRRAVRAARSIARIGRTEAGLMMASVSAPDGTVLYDTRPDGAA